MIGSEALGYTLIEGFEVKADIHPGETQNFLLPVEDLRPQTQYEVRISYLGTVGAAFSIEWECLSARTGKFKLLDTEKLVFRTDERGQIKNLPCQTDRIRVKMIRNSKAKSEQFLNSKTSYFIKLENFSGPVPSSVVPSCCVGAALICLSFIVWKGLFPLLKNQNNLKPN